MAGCAGHLTPGQQFCNEPRPCDTGSLGAPGSPSALLYKRVMDGGVTIGDLKHDDQLLELGRLACGRHLYVDPAGVALDDHLPLPGVRVLGLRGVESTYMVLDLGRARCTGAESALRLSGSMNQRALRK